MADPSFQVVEKPAPAGTAEGALVLALVGSADVTGGQVLDQYLRKIAAARPRLVVFDLSHLSYISSVGIGVMLNYLRLSEGWGGKVRLAAPNDLVDGIFRQSKLDSILPIVPSVALATLD
jgi:anti-anti-sigma factor